MGLDIQLTALSGVSLGTELGSGLVSKEGTLPAEIAAWRVEGAPVPKGPISGYLAFNKSCCVAEAKSVLPRGDLPATMPAIP